MGATWMIEQLWEHLCYKNYFKPGGGISDTEEGV
jgi:hypothetical protein